MGTNPLEGPTPVPQPSGPPLPGKDPSQQPQPANEPATISLGGYSGIPNTLRAAQEKIVELLGLLKVRADAEAADRSALNEAMEKVWRPKAKEHQSDE